MITRLVIVGAAVLVTQLALLAWPHPPCWWCGHPPASQDASACWLCALRRRIRQGRNHQ